MQKSTEHTFSIFHPDVLDSALKRLDTKLALVNLLSLDQKSSEYLLRKAKIYILKQDFLQSIQLLQKVSSSSVPFYVFEANYFLGQLHHRLCDYDMATTEFTNAIAIFPSLHVKERKAQEHLPWHRKIQKTFLDAQQKRHQWMKSVSDKAPHLLDPYSFNEKRLQRDALEKELFEFLHQHASEPSCTLDELYNARGLSHFVNYNFQAAWSDFQTALQQLEAVATKSNEKLQAYYLNCGLALYYRRQFEDSEMWFTKSIEASVTTTQQGQQGMEESKRNHGVIQSHLYRCAVRERTNQQELALEDKKQVRKYKGMEEVEQIEYFHFRLMSLEMLWEVLSFLDETDVQYNTSLVSRFFYKQCRYVVAHASLFGGKLAKKK